MKKILLLTSLAFLFLLPSQGHAQKKGSLIIEYTFKNIVEGYDHKNKIMVYADGEKVGESPEKLESQPNKVTIKLSRGEHDIKVVNYAFYQGKWEEHTIDNTYGQDFTYQSKIFIGKKTKLTLLFDIDKGTTADLK
jgi:hypothetical protein